MRRISVFALMFLLSIQLLQAQTALQSGQKKLAAANTSVSIVYSFGGNDLYSSKELVGGPSYSGKGFYGFGALASIEVFKNLDIVTGFSYVGNRFEVTPAFVGVPQLSHDENINMFSVPLLAKYHFLKFLYVSAGPVFSINSGDRDMNGIGATANFGAEYGFKSGLVLSFGPILRFHGLLPWKNYRLVNSGVNFGIGYRF